LATIKTKPNTKKKKKSKDHNTSKKSGIQGKYGRKKLRGGVKKDGQKTKNQDLYLAGKNRKGDPEKPN